MAMTDKEVLSFVKHWEAKIKGAVQAKGFVSDFKDAFFKKYPPYKEAVLIQEGKVQHKGKDLDFIVFGNVILTDDEGKRFVDSLIITNPKEENTILSFEL